MYLKQIVVSSSIFSFLFIGCFFLNQQLKEKEQQQMNMIPADYQQLSATTDATIVERSLALPPYKPREYVKIGATNYVISQGKSILE
ncbi:hypothetical protein FZC66_18375 [Priestia megaterium]|nr:hypothetical protein FZC66_18375 [Priestia megaterium]